MCWRVRHGDILDEPADVLVCSANPYLTLSGGVGGALLLRYGPTLQDELRSFLSRSGRRYVERGNVVVTRPTSTPYKAVIHAVAVNAFYESSAEVIADTVRAALRAAADEPEVRTVALTALATGYGRMDLSTFGRGLSEVFPEAFPPLSVVTIVVRQPGDVATLQRAVPGIDAAS